MVVLKDVCKVDVVLQRFTVSVIVAGLEDSSNVTRVIVLVAVTVYSGDSFTVRVDRESVMVFSTRLVLSTRVRCVDVLVRMIRVVETVDDARRVDVFVRVMRVSEGVDVAIRVDVLVRVAKICDAVDDARCVDVCVRMIRVSETVDVPRRVVVLIRVIRVGEAVEDARLVDDTVGGPCKETVEMVLTIVVVERKCGGTRTTTVLEASMRDAGSTTVRTVVVELASPLL